MRRTPFFVGGLAVLGLALLGACGGDDDSPRRVVQIVQTDAGCSPAFIEAKAGEKLKFEVKNEGKKDKEIEGIEGADLEELLIPSGKTRSVNYSAPGKAAVEKIKCYDPSGESTIIEVRVSQ